jgi:hypothetical protein
MIIGKRDFEYFSQAKRGRQLMVWSYFSAHFAVPIQPPGQVGGERARGRTVRSTSKVRRR